MSKKPNTSRWTVAKYFEEVYLPERAEQRGMPITEPCANWYRYILRRADAILGHPMKLREVTPELFEKIERALVKQNYARDTAKRCREVIRAIVRHWKPDAIPELPQGHHDMPFLNSDVPATLEHLFIHRYLPVRTTITSKATIAHYGRVFRLFAEFLGYAPTTAELNDETCGKFLRWMVEVKGVKAVSANGYWKQLRALWEWCARKRLTAEFPTLQQLPEPEVVPEAWSYEELQKLLQACKDARGKIGGIPAADYWLAFHYVQWDTGERTGAMNELTWNMIDWKAGHMVVPAEVRKGGCKAMVYHLKQPTRNLLERIREPKRELIFGTGKRWRFYADYKKLIKAAGLAHVPHKCGPQKMRRSFASHLEALGGNATKALRHTSRLVTEESYLDPRISEPESQNLKLPHLGDL